MNNDLPTAGSYFFSILYPQLLSYCQILHFFAELMRILFPLILFFLPVTHVGQPKVSSLAASYMCSLYAIILEAENLRLCFQFP